MANASSSILSRLGTWEGLLLVILIITVSVNAALVRFTYPRAMLGRGMGINTLIVAGSSAAGPSIAAGILSVAPWPWLFAFSVPIGILALALSTRTLPEVAAKPAKFDLPSAALSGVNPLHTE